jgi:phosphate:Na+ symporter
MELIANFLAGFAFFLVGMNAFTASLNQLISERFRDIMTRFTPNGFAAAIWGILMNIFTAGSTVLTPIISGGLVSAEAISLRHSIIMIVWGRIGFCAYIYLASFNIKLAIMLVIGGAGISYAIERPKDYRIFMSSVFYLCLMLLGIFYITDGTASMTQAPWFKAIIDQTRNYPALAFLSGGLFLFLSQSAFGTMLIATSMFATRTFDSSQTILFLYGCYFGECILEYLYRLPFRGIFKQILTLMPLFFVCATTISLLDLLITYVFKIQIIHYLSSLLSKNQNFYVANTNLLVHLITASLFTLLIIPVEKLINWMSPEADGTLIQAFSLPKEMLEDPITTLFLIRREDTRTIRYLPKYMEAIRLEKVDADPEYLDKLHKQISSNLEEVGNTLSNLLNRHEYGKHISHRIYRRIENQTLLESLNENLYEQCVLVKMIREAEEKEGKDTHEILAFTNAIEAVVLSLVDFFTQTQDSFNQETILTITTSRQQMMNKIRDSYIGNLSEDVQPEFIKLVNLFETSIWLIRRLAKSKLTS